MDSDRLKKIALQETKNLSNVLADVDFKQINSFGKILASANNNVLITGAGTSASNAKRMAHLLSCCGLAAYFVHPADQQHGASGALKEDDIIIAFSKGGETDELNNFLKIAKNNKCTLLAITAREDSTMMEIIDRKILYKTPENAELMDFLPTFSTLLSDLFINVICRVVIEKSGFDKKGFGDIHPGGFVGKQIKNNDL